VSTPERDSTAEIVRNAASDIKDIASAQVRLGIEELREDASKLRRLAPLIGSCVMLAVAAVLFGLHAVALAFDVVVPAWAAYAGVSIATGIVAVALLVRLRNALIRADLKPRRTLASLQETGQWMAQKLS
jgi:uncharacterized membrane protein YqjE